MPSNREKIKVPALKLASAESKSKAKRLCEVFDIFRQDPWGHPDGPFSTITPINTDKSLVKWLIHTSNSAKLNTIRAFLRVLRKGITRRNIEMNAVEFLDIFLEKKKIEQCKPSFNAYTFESYKNNACNLFSALNRKVERKTQKWHIKNMKFDDVPEWITNYQPIDMKKEEWKVLKNDIQNVTQVSAEKQESSNKGNL